MRVLISQHARRRLGEMRQGTVTLEDVRAACQRIPGRVPTATRFRGFVASSGRVFDVVVKDVPRGRLVVTIIGK